MPQKSKFIDRSRTQKAKQIEAVLSNYLASEVEGRHILDIGCGNGEISDYFQAKNEVASVDLSDRRRNKDSGVEFELVDSEIIPFEDGRFDIVISNHVLEHVPDQALHMSEIRRLLKPAGICYLATPNRTSPFMEEHEGNELVFRYRQMGPFFRKQGFDWVEYGVQCAKHPDKYHITGQTPKWLPVALLKLIRPLFPSHIFILIPATSLS